LPATLVCGLHLSGRHRGCVDSWSRSLSYVLGALGGHRLTKRDSSRGSEVGSFGVLVRPGPSSTGVILRASQDPYSDIALRGHIFVAFNGQSPVRPEHDRRITEDGWIPTHLPVVLWDLVAACRRVIQTERSREYVLLHPTDLGLALQRKAGLVRVALGRVDAPGAPLAETEVTIQAVKQACLVPGDSLYTWMVTTNPELRGNQSVEGFHKSLDSLRHAGGDERV
jgi:hypothetical protein